MRPAHNVLLFPFAISSPERKLKIVLDRVYDYDYYERSSMESNPTEVIAMDKARYLYSALASAVQARKNCQERNNDEWFDTWSTQINNLVKQFMPSGSGIDSGTTIDLDASHGEKLVFHAPYHHMNDGGYYDGWTEHIVTVTPSFTGINIRISGRDRNQIKDYLYQTFDYALSQEITDEQILDSRK